MTAGQAWRPDVQHLQPTGVMPAVTREFGLPHVFSPAEAAHLLRQAGLTEITECALRTRAYRKQVPFHLNGRRIVFTLRDLHEIAEGSSHRPHAEDKATAPVARPSSAPRRRPRSQQTPATTDPWRARRPPDGDAGARKGPRT